MRAHIDPSAHGGDRDLLNWPEAIKPHKTPTPYQILRCGKGDAYSKNRFYALVKLYHPDRCHAASAVAHLPLHVRLERYRMLVAAHDILSDIEKRKAYDAWGHGWVGHHNTPAGAATHHHHSWEYDQRRWTSDPRYNATWEDWERWHSENDASKEPDGRTIQMSNFAFMSLIFAFVSIGGVVQGTRFSTLNNSVIERRDQIHREASMELRRSKDATMSGDRDERIRTFLEHRESTIMGEQSYQRLLPPADTCAPDEVRRR
ncbi:J domain-containing protein 1 [Neocucurbitaria cava]|uniref:J domain-containing protein 1 n=1 Tax=Neocucurbitaria cava TaxID=798079 RepID=A0A9W8Y359_9PLEO|nr:J domain-containing protein 1 [Neocucurbitaria cava]